MGLGTSFLSQAVRNKRESRQPNSYGCSALHGAAYGIASRDRQGSEMMGSFSWGFQDCAQVTTKRFLMQTK